MTREEAIKELNTFKIIAKSESGKKALDIAIQTLEQDLSRIPLQGWIPVSKRLPSEAKVYLVTTALDIGSGELVKDVYRDYFCNLSKKWLYHNNEVIAWMPLPAPYGENEE